MLDLLCIIAKYLEPHVHGLSVSVYVGKIEDFVLDHSIGAFLLSEETGRLTVHLVFRDSSVRVAGEYLEFVRHALAGGVPMDDGTLQTFTFERNHFVMTDRIEQKDIHAATYLIDQREAKSLELKAEYTSEIETD